MRSPPLLVGFVFLFSIPNNNYLVSAQQQQQRDLQERRDCSRLSEECFPGSQVIQCGTLPATCSGNFVDLAAEQLDCKNANQSTLIVCGTTTSITDFNGPTEKTVEATTTTTTAEFDESFQSGIYTDEELRSDLGLSGFVSAYENSFVDTCTSLLAELELQDDAEWCKVGSAFKCDSEPAMCGTFSDATAECPNGHLFICHYNASHVVTFASTTSEGSDGTSDGNGDAGLPTQTDTTGDAGGGEKSSSMSFTKASWAITWICLVVVVVLQFLVADL